MSVLEDADWLEAFVPTLHATATRMGQRPRCHRYADDALGEAMQLIDSARRLLATRAAILRHKVRMGYIRND